VRLYAEDPFTFLPAPGALGMIRFPSGPFVRVDTALTEAGEVSMNYDPMIAKISTWGTTREEAIARMRVALDETRVEPPKKPDGSRSGSLRTNLEFLRKLARHPDVLGGDTTTDLIARNADLTAQPASEMTPEAAIALSLHQLLLQTKNSPQAGVGQPRARSNWKWIARREGVRS